MREDMFKVIVERPRRGWRSRPHKRETFAGEFALPTKMGVRRHVSVMGIKSKWLNENLKPLERYLGRQVGRPWDQVYSEIAATLAPGHVVKEHVRQHLDDFVARRLSVSKDGTWNGDRRRWPGDGPWYQPYYVDPTDGILKDSEVRWIALGIEPRPWRRRKPPGNPDIRVLEPMIEHRRIGGLWYQVDFHIDPEALRWVFDLVERVEVPARQRHAVAKRQLSHAELKQFGLSNETRQ